MATDDIATPLLNIIILTPEEEVITWLIPDITDIKEINEKDKVRQIELTYPVEDRKIYEEERPWFSQGNKIFIPAIFGLTNCLYVINTEYQIDYWDKNYVTINAEEVLTELNNQIVGVYSKNSIKITKDKLKEWFGRWYTIGDLETLASTKNSIQQLGTTTLMTLLRTIEEKTERVFLTEYTYKDNIIYRKLSLVKEETLRQTAGTEFLDLNYNLDSLDLTVSEEKTYSAMAPELSINEQKGTTSADYINANDSRTSTDAVQNTLSAEEIYQNWLDLEVEYREEIPMIQEKKADGSVSTTQNWYAPFMKKKGSLYIENVTWSGSNYRYIQPPASVSVSEKEKIPNPLPKCGTVSTSETDAYAIYNVLANSLLEKLNPKFELKVKVSDITQILGLKNLGYNLYETLYVKIPGFDYWVPAYITKTTKNPHEPGNDTITVETDVKGSHNRKVTQILLKNTIISKNSDASDYGGVLVDEKGNPIANELVTVNVRLKEAYTAAPTVTTPVAQFKPNDETYYFPKNEILTLEKSLRKKFVSDYVLYDIRGTAYSIPLEWCLAIYYSYIQHYINTDYPLGAGKFPDSVPVHYYSDATEQLKTNNDFKYYPSFYIQYMDNVNKFFDSNKIEGERWWGICSSELQSGDTCVANAIANATAYNFIYHTESEVLQLLGNKKITTSSLDTDVIPVLKKIGYEVDVVEFNQNNINTYFLSRRVTALVTVDSSILDYSTATNVAHEMIIYSAYTINGKMTLFMADSNRGYMNPASANQFNIHSPEYKFEDVRNAIIITKEQGKIKTRTNKAQKPYMILIKATEEQAQTGTETTNRNASNIVPNKSNNNTDTEDHPDLVTFNFNMKEIRKTFKNGAQDRNNQFLRTYPITDTSGVTRHINIFHVYSLALRYMSTWYNSHLYANIFENINYATGAQSSSTAIFNVMKNEQFVPSTIQIVSVIDNNHNKYILSWLLFNMGYLVPPCATWGHELDLDDIGGAGENLSADQWTRILKYFDSNVKTKYVDFSESNVHQYTQNPNHILFFFVSSTFVNSLGTPTVTAPAYPAFILGYDNDRYPLFIPHLKGTVPKTLGRDAQTSDGYYQLLKYNEIQVSTTDAFGFKNKMLVISNTGDL